MESTVGTTDTLNSAIYKTVDKVYLPSAGDQEFQDKDRNGPLTFLVGSSTEENASGSLVFSSDYWLPRPQTVNALLGCHDLVLSCCHEIARISVMECSL